MNRSLLLIFYFLLFTISCSVNSTSNKSSNIQAKNESMEMSENKIQELLSQGFVSVKVIKNKNQDCSILLITEDGKGLDPINFKEIVKGEADTIWIKFSYLRMRNRCNDGQPININEVYGK